MSDPKPKSKTYANSYGLTKKQIFFGLCILLVLLRLPTLFIPVLDVDEAIYGLFTRAWFNGGIPYIDGVETKPLGIYFFYGIIFKIFGDYNMIAVHFFTIVVNGLTAYILYLITAILHNKRTGAWAALFYIVFTTTYIPKVIATTIEPIMLLPICLQFYLWMRFERDHLLRYAFLSGMAFSAACLFKYQAGINLFVIVLYLMIIRPLFIKKGSIKETFRDFGYFILGGMPLPLIMISYLGYAGALSAFYFWNILGNLTYIQGGSNTLGFLRQILTRVLPFVASTILLWVLFARRSITVGRTLFGLSRRSRRAAHEWLILLWFLLTIIPVSTGKRFYGHYFLLLIPAMSILAAPVMDRIFTEGKKWKKWLAIAWIIIPAVGFAIPRYFIDDINKKVGEDNPNDYMPIAKYVAERTKPTDRIITWGYAPLVYWYSERMPGTRFFWSDTLTGRVPGLRQIVFPIPDTTLFTVPGSWDMFFEDMEKHKPKYIIDTTPPDLHDYLDYPIDNYPRLMEYVDDNYVEETQLNGVVFYRRKGTSAKP